MSALSLLVYLLLKTDITEYNLNMILSLCLYFLGIQVKQLVKFKGNESALPEADLFMLMLVKIPR